MYQSVCQSVPAKIEMGGWLCQCHCTRESGPGAGAGANVDADMVREIASAQRVEMGWSVGRSYRCRWIRR